MTGAGPFEASGFRRIDHPTWSGPHFVNPLGGQPLEQREVWLDFTVDAKGTGHNVATRDWLVPAFAERSVVIHAAHTDHETGATGGRLACTDIDG